MNSEPGTIKLMSNTADRSSILMSSVNETDAQASKTKTNREVKQLPL